MNRHPKFCQTISFCHKDFFLSNCFSQSIFNTEKKRKEKGGYLPKVQLRSCHSYAYILLMAPLAIKIKIKTWLKIIRPDTIPSLPLSLTSSHATPPYLIILQHHHPSVSRTHPAPVQCWNFAHAVSLPGIPFLMLVSFSSFRSHFNFFSLERTCHLCKKDLFYPSPLFSFYALVYFFYSS